MIRHQNIQWATSSCNVLWLDCFHWNDASTYQQKYLFLWSLPHSHGCFLVYSESQWLNFLQRKDLWNNPWGKEVKEPGNVTTKQSKFLNRKWIDLVSVLNSFMCPAVASLISLKFRRVMQMYQDGHFVPGGYRIVVRRKMCPSCQSRYLLWGSVCHLHLEVLALCMQWSNFRNTGECSLGFFPWILDVTPADLTLELPSDFWFCFYPNVQKTEVLGLF